MAGDCPYQGFMTMCVVPNLARREAENTDKSLLMHHGNAHPAANVAKRTVHVLLVHALVGDCLRRVSQDVVNDDGLAAQQSIPIAVPRLDRVSASGCCRRS